MKSTLLTLILLTTCFATYAQEKRPFEIRFKTDNDIFPWIKKSDHYYTYGIFATVSFETKSGKRWKIFQGKEVITEINYGLQAFTPSNYLDNEDHTSFDRPFAGWHYLGYGRKVNARNQMMYLGISAGMIGSKTGAGRFQNWFHEKINVYRVEGWENQIKNQFGINLLFDYKKMIFAGEANDFILESNSSIGNIFLHTTSQIRWRVGKFSPIHTSSMYNNRILSQGEPEYFLTISGGYKVIGYNATLQGGMFNDEQLLPARELNRGVGILSCGFYVSVQKFSASMEITYTRGEVERAMNHKYGSITISYIL